MLRGLSLGIVETFPILKTAIQDKIQTAHPNANVRGAGGPGVKNPPADAGTPGSIPGPKSPRALEPRLATEGAPREIQSAQRTESKGGEPGRVQHSFLSPTGQPHIHDNLPYFEGKAPHREIQFPAVHTRVIYLTV